MLQTACYKAPNNKRGRWECDFSALHGSNPKNTNKAYPLVWVTTYSTITKVIYKPQSKECHAASVCSAVIGGERWNIYIWLHVCLCVCICLFAYKCVCVCVSGSPEKDAWVYCSCVFCASWITGVVVVECPQRGSVFKKKKGRLRKVCVWCVQWLPHFFVHIWGGRGGVRGGGTPWLVLSSSWWCYNMRSTAVTNGLLLVFYFSVNWGKALIKDPH